MDTLRRTSVYLHQGDVVKMDAIGRTRGLKLAQLIRIACREWLRRQPRQNKKS